MKLAAAEVIPYALPFRRPYVTARGTLGKREMVLLRLRDEDGLVGLGEAVPLSLRGGPTLVDVVTELLALAGSDALQRLVDTPGAASAGPPLSAPARCAIATALLDLREKELQVEKAPDRPVPCNATLVAGEPAAVAEDARQWSHAGFSTFKLKLGAGEDVAQVDAVRRAVGDDARIRVDANGAWSLETAKRVLAELEPFDIELVEQPVATVEEAAELARSTSIPLAGDESIVSPADARRAIGLGAFALTGIKLSKVGGLTTGVEIAAAMPAYVASALDGPVGIAAARRLAELLHWEAPRADNPHLAHGLATQRLFAETIASAECELRGGMLHEPPGPGLGVEIDENALAAHRLDRHG